MNLFQVKYRSLNHISKNVPTLQFHIPKEKVNILYQ